MFAYIVILADYKFYISQSYVVFMAKKKGRALFIGRFQPFHKGHQSAISELLKKHEEVIVVIGSAEDSFTGPNPFTTGERVDMIRSCFSKSDVSRLIIVPVRDINDNRMWVEHIVSYIPPFTEVYSNNMLVKMLFSQVGILVNPTKLLDREGKEGTYIRSLMAEGNPEWQKHIPSKVIGYLDEISAEERMKKIARMGGLRLPRRSCSQ